MKKIIITAIAILMLCCLVGIDKPSVYTESGSSAVSEAEAREAAVNAMDNDSVPPVATETNTLYVKAGTSGHETFTANEIKTIPQYVYWDVPGEVFGYFLMGYLMITFDPAVVEPVRAQSGAFSTRISRQGPGWIIVDPWMWYPGESDPELLAFNITWRGLQAGTTGFDYTVTDSSGNYRGYFLTGTVHNMQRVTAVMEYVPMIQPPAAPTHLVATAVSSSQIDLTWQDNSDNEDGFIIEGKVNCFSDFVEIAKVGPNVTSYSDKRALTGAPHFYRVRAYNEAGNSDYSNIASATTPTPMDDILSALARLYQEGAIKAGLYNPLLVKLQAAQNAQNFNAALNQLNAFANQVQAQTGKGITNEASQTLLALNQVLIAYTNPDKIASGYALIATFKPTDYPAVRIEARETPEPYVPYGGADNRAYIFEVTPGVLNLYYYDGVGQCVNIKRNIEINNITRVIYYNGAPVTTIREIFSDLLPTPAGDYMYLTMDFPYWLTIFMTPVSHLQIQSYMDDFTTDKGRPIVTIPDGRPSPPLSPEEGRDRTVTEDNNSSINGHSRGALISMGVITRTGIPTDSYNCWGWTFTCGSAWMNDPIDVDNVLSDNGYTQITPAASVPAKPGDVIVYRDDRGAVLHTGIVRKVDPATGQPTIVESKWGPWGLYLHPPETAPADYLPEGGKIEYWRAPETRQAPANSTDPDKERHTLPVG